MPNRTGGKAYKKTKHGGDDEKSVFVDRLPGQMYGRVIRILGGLNVLVYCNDGYERICHIRGSLRKRTWLYVGDIVLISLRMFEEEKKGSERGDILTKYEAKFYSKIKKEPDINLNLFANIETVEGTKKRNVLPDNENGYEIEQIEDTDEESNEESGEEEDSEESSSSEIPNSQYHKNNRNQIIDNDDDVDIDNI
jgi:translation initiation factor 1A